MHPRLLILITTFALAFLWVAEPLKPQDAAATCVSNTASRADVISACTALIEDGRTAPDYRHLFLTERAWAHSCNRHSDNAIADVDRALALQPKNYKTWVLRAQINDANGDHETARADYERALKLSPQSSYVNWRRAKFLDKHGDRGAAFEGYQQVLRANPNASNAAKRSMIYLADVGEYERALQMASAAAETWPDDYRFYAMLIQLHVAHTKDVDAALDAAQRGIDLKDQPLSEYFYQAVIHLSIGDEQKGVEFIDGYVTSLIERSRSKWPSWDWLKSQLNDYPNEDKAERYWLRAVTYALLAREDLARPELLRFLEISGPVSKERLIAAAEKEGLQLSEREKQNAELIVSAYVAHLAKDAPSWNTGRK